MSDSYSNLPNRALLEAVLTLGDSAKNSDELKKLLIIAYNEGFVNGLQNGNRNKRGNPTQSTRKLSHKARAIIGKHTTSLGDLNDQEE